MNKWIGLGTVLVALAGVACSKKDDDKNPATKNPATKNPAKSGTEADKNTNPKDTAKTTTKQVADTPQKAVTMYFAFMHASDAEGLWGLFSENARKGFNQMFKGMSPEQATRMLGKDGPAMLKLEGLELMKKIAASEAQKKRVAAMGKRTFKLVRTAKCADEPKLVACRRDPTGTVVFFSQGNENETCRMRVVQEGGSWKLTTPSVACRSSSNKGDSAKNKTSKAKANETSKPKAK